MIRGERADQLVTHPEPEFEAFFHIHYDPLVRSLTVITGDRETARDCVQEAFIKAAVRWRRVRRYDNPVAWVRRVAINRSRDLHRSTRRRQRRESLTSDGGVGDLDPAGMVDGQLTMAALIARLPPRQRSAVALYYIDDLPLAEIADGLGITVGAVKCHLNQARATLRHALEREGYRHAR
jgi:RNA polymerase sigma-70 factor, ECF subfamily